MQADGLRITLQWWIHVGKVVNLVLTKGGKLPRPCGAAFMSVMITLSSNRNVPASSLDVEGPMPNRALAAVETRAKLRGRESLLLRGL